MSVLYSNGASTPLGGSGTLAYGINNLGQIVGNNGNGAYIYTGRNLVGLGIGNPSALAINDSSLITGTIQTKTGFEAYTYSYPSGQLSILGTIGDAYSTGFAINSSGEVVGRLDFLDESVEHAFVYSPGTSEIQDLNVLYASLLVSGTDSQAGFTTLNQATGVNDSGEIVGNGQYWDGTSFSNEAFALTVPEPSILSLLVAGGILGLMGRRWAKFQSR